ncbi:hypothetical protein [Halorubrum sp. BOL3-1]|uniref:hypothetical protein n=1 Tax=Halorubrum sp. BOL3-1 TaxID=2497325 RepID=UPI001F4F34AF|nr:hypothetical protein [Halorubrum sp. BOL3-1]
MNDGAGRAVEFAGPERVDAVPIDDPVPGPDEVVVEAAVSAVNAGSELLAYRGEPDPGTVADAPTAYRRLADERDAALQILFTY